MFFEAQQLDSEKHCFPLTWLPFMRGILLTLAATLWALPGRAQVASTQTLEMRSQEAGTAGTAHGTAEPRVLDYAEQMPAFTGGAPALHQLLTTHLVYPPEAFKAGRSGNVVVQFVVDEQGRTRDVETVRTSDPVFDAAARRVVMLMPWWTPGMDKGQSVRVRCTLPIIFTFRRNP